MDVITHEHLRNLIDADHSPCVSIYMPTFKAAPDSRQNPVRLKDLVREAEKQLVDVEPRADDARRVLEPVRSLIEDEAFWAESDRGLAIFAADGFLKTVRIPFEPEELASVNGSFCVKPLLPILQNKHFYILAVSHNAVRLLACDSHICRHVPLPDDVALSQREAAGPEDEHETTTLKHGGGSFGAARGGVFHGQAVDIQSKEHEDMLFYLRQVDDGVRRVMHDQNATLILAGAPSVVPFYRQISQCHNILPQAIDGNWEHTSDEDLSQKARQVIEPMWHKELNDLQERYGTAKAQQLASNDIDEIVQAAEQGRVDVLFMATNISYWGTEDDDGRLERHDEQQFGDHDLVEKAAIGTLRTSGRIVAVLPDQIPNNGELAAIYRY